MNRLLIAAILCFEIIILVGCGLMVGKDKDQNADLPYPINNAMPRNTGFAIQDQDANYWTIWVPVEDLRKGIPKEHLGDTRIYGDFCNWDYNCSNLYGAWEGQYMVYRNVPKAYAGQEWLITCSAMDPRTHTPRYSYVASQGRKSMGAGDNDRFPFMDLLHQNAAQGGYTYQPRY